MRPVRRAALLVTCWLLAGLAWAGMPSPDQYLPSDPGTAASGGSWDWVATAAYFGPIAVASCVPRRYWYVMPLAFCWPFLFWLGAWVSGR